LWRAQGNQIGEWRVESRFYIEPIRAHLAKNDAQKRLLNCRKRRRLIVNER
jgi:hypothetical protein